MRRLIVIFGVILMVFAFVVLTIFIIAPAVVSSLDDAPLLRNIMQGLVCQPGEVLTASYSTYSRPGSTSRTTDLQCVDRQRNARDVSGDLIGIGAVGYLVPFLVGLFMTLLAGTKNMQRVIASAARERGFTDSERDAWVATASDGVTILNPSGHVPSQIPHPSKHLPLAQRLQELKEAYDAGLVTEAEYNAKRQELLDEE